MVAVSMLYLNSSTMLVPSLWLDPLGPLVNVFPSIVRACVLMVVLEDR